MCWFHDFRFPNPLRHTWKNKTCKDRVFYFWKCVSMADQLRANLTPASVMSSAKSELDWTMAQWKCVLLRDESHYCWLHCGNCEVWWKTDNRMDLFPRALAWFWLPEKGRSQCFSKQLFWVVPHCRIIFPLLHNKKSLCMIIKPRRTWESGTSVTQWTNLQGLTM